MTTFITTQAMTLKRKFVFQRAEDVEHDVKRKMLRGSIDCAETETASPIDLEDISATGCLSTTLSANNGCEAKQISG
jgi:hypothetical protein